MLFFTYNTDVLHKKVEKDIIFIYIIRYIDNIYINILYIAAIYIRTREELHPHHSDTPNLFASSCLPACLPLLLLSPPPPISPHGAQPRPLPYVPSPYLAAVVRSGCHTTRRLAFRRSSGTHAALRAAFCKIFFQAREAFRLFRAVLPSSFVPAL